MIDLRYGDCLEIMKEIEDKTIDFILCDLPYGITANKWDKRIPFKYLWSAYKRIIKDNGVICLFAREPFTSELIESNPKMFRYRLVWDKISKSGFLNSGYRPLCQTEDVVIFSKATVGSKSKNPITYYPQGVKEVGILKHNNPNSTWRVYMGYKRNGNELNTRKEYLQKFANYPSDILQFPLDRKKIHPTQKPVALCEYLVKTYTLPGEVVLDNCMGSGTTGVACYNAGRNFIGIEKDKEFYDKALSRISSLEKAQFTAGEDERESELKKGKTQAG